MKIAIIGIDLTKEIFQGHGVNLHGKAVLRKHSCVGQPAGIIMPHMQACFVGRRNVLVLTGDKFLARRK